MSPLSLVSRTARARPRNRILAQLPEEDFQRLRPYLQTVSLGNKQVLHKQGEPIRDVYFPNGGVVSMMTLMADGAMVEAATIGDNGLVGIEAFFDDRAISACETIVQVPVPADDAERMSIQDFRRQLLLCTPLRQAVGRYMETLYAIMARLNACNASHDVSERCARWLLMTHDRMHRRPFHLSHEFLAVMLGVRRQSVSVVAGTFRKSGLIDYIHGRITILDRTGLEAAACECYTVIRALTDGAAI